MEKIYWKSQIQNFGDELNLNFYEKALGLEVSKYRPNESILGIGSILHFDTSNHSKIHVLGSGSASAEINLKNKDRYKFWFVRGPLTAQSLGIEKKLGISDPAIITPQVYGYQDHSMRKNGTLFIPHYFSAMNADWTKVCLYAGMNYLSPTSNVEKICREIQSSKLVITESLHGAILADVFRVPWIPVAQPPVGRSPFKWMDWLSTVNITYKPSDLPWLSTKRLSTSLKAMNFLKSNFAKRGVGPHRWVDKNYHTHGLKEIEHQANLLREIKSGAQQNLSDDKKLDSLQSQMMERLDSFRSYLIS